jgi:MoxR-like ATPase
METEYKDIYCKLKEIQKKILSKAPSDYNENLPRRIKKINSQEEIIREIADNIQRKYPDFDHEIIYKKIKEKVEILTERYYNAYPQKMDTLVEKKRFNHYLDFEIKDDIEIENETISRFGDLEKIEDLEVLKNFENYLANKKTQLEKDTYLYEGLEHTIQLVKTKISLLERRSKVSGSLRNFAKYLKKILKPSFQ